MAIPDSDTIKVFLDKKIILWNQGKEAELEDLYREMAPNELTFEYVGGPIIDGWQALKDMWQQFGENVEMELVDTFVNGSEVACYVKNHRRNKPGTYNTTIEVYSFGEGKLHERYFFNAEELT